MTAAFPQFTKIVTCLCFFKKGNISLPQLDWVCNKDQACLSTLTRTRRQSLYSSQHTFLTEPLTFPPSSPYFKQSAHCRLSSASGGGVSSGLSSKLLSEPQNRERKRKRERERKDWSLLRNTAWKKMWAGNCLLENKVACKCPEQQTVLAARLNWKGFLHFKIKHNLTNHADVRGRQRKRLGSDFEVPADGG